MLHLLQAESVKDVFADLAVFVLPSPGTLDTYIPTLSTLHPLDLSDPEPSTPGGRRLLCDVRRSLHLAPSPVVPHTYLCSDFAMTAALLVGTQCSPRLSRLRNSNVRGPLRSCSVGKPLRHPRMSVIQHTYLQYLTYSTSGGSRPVILRGPSRFVQNAATRALESLRPPWTIQIVIDQDLREPKTVQGLSSREPGLRTHTGGQLTVLQVPPRPRPHSSVAARLANGATSRLAVVVTARPHHD